MSLTRKSRGEIIALLHKFSVLNHNTWGLGQESPAGSPIHTSGSDADCGPSFFLTWYLVSQGKDPNREQGELTLPWWSHLGGLWGHFYFLSMTEAEPKVPPVSWWGKDFHIPMERCWCHITITCEVDTYLCSYLWEIQSGTTLTMEFHAQYSKQIFGQWWDGWSSWCGSHHIPLA